MSKTLVECCFTSTETVGTGALDGHLGFHAAPELSDVENAVTKRHNWPENKILDVWFCMALCSSCWSRKGRPSWTKPAVRRLVPLDTALSMD